MHQQTTATKNFNPKNNTMLTRKKMYAVETIINGKFIQMKAFLKLVDAKKYASQFDSFRIIKKNLITLI